jgi:hypothetical protein
VSFLINLLNDVVIVIKSKIMMHCNVRMHRALS